MVVRDYWTFEDVQERLVEAVRLWWRTPGGGTSPFATDGPWHLVRDDGSAQAAWDERVNNHKMGHQPRPRPLPLSMEEVDERDEASEWIRFVPERDKRLVVLALTQLATGRQVKWSRIRMQLTAEISPRGLGQRYSRAISAIARALNSADFRASGVSRRVATNRS